MRSIDAPTSHSGTSPAAHRIGITIVENGGTIEVTLARPEYGLLRTEEARKKLPTSRMVSGAVTFCTSSCRDTSAASAAYRQAEKAKPSRNQMITRPAPPAIP